MIDYYDVKFFLFFLPKQLFLSEMLLRLSTLEALVSVGLRTVIRKMIKTDQISTAANLLPNQHFLKFL